MIVAGFEELVESASIRCGGFWLGDIVFASVQREMSYTLLDLDINAEE
jgi:hypothetical protein